jgi:hypothetical protein
MARNYQFVPVDYKQIQTNTGYDKKLHDQMVNDPNILNAMLKRSSGFVDLKETPGENGNTVLKISPEVSIDGSIPVLTNQPRCNVRYGEYNNFVKISIYGTILKYSN